MPSVFLRAFRERFALRRTEAKRLFERGFVAPQATVLSRLDYWGVTSIFKYVYHLNYSPQLLIELF